MRKILVLLVSVILIGCYRQGPATHGLWNGKNGALIDITALNSDDLKQLQTDNPGSTIVTSTDGSRRYLKLQGEFYSSTPVKILLTPVTLVIDGVAYLLYGTVFVLKTVTVQGN